MKYSAKSLRDTLLFTINRILYLKEERSSVIKMYKFKNVKDCTDVGFIVFYTHFKVLGFMDYFAVCCSLYLICVCLFEAESVTRLEIKVNG